MNVSLLIKSIFFNPTNPKLLDCSVYINNIE